MELGRPGTALWRRSRAVWAAQTSRVEPDRATFTPAETQRGGRAGGPALYAQRVGKYLLANRVGISA